MVYLKFKLDTFIIHCKFLLSRTVEGKNAKNYKIKILKFLFREKNNSQIMLNICFPLDHWNIRHNC